MNRVSQKLSIWISYYGSSKGQACRPNTLFHKLELIKTDLKDFKEKMLISLKYLGDIEVEPIYDEFFKEYVFSSNAVDIAVENIGINLDDELPCLEKGKCIEFINAYELNEYLKQCIDEYNPPSEIEKNELIIFINSLKEYVHPLLGKKLPREKKFESNEIMKIYIKGLLDNYIGEE